MFRVCRNVRVRMIDCIFVCGLCCVPVRMVIKISPNIRTGMDTMIITEDKHVDGTGNEVTSLSAKPECTSRRQVLTTYLKMCSMTGEV